MKHTKIVIDKDNKEARKFFDSLAKERNRIDAKWKFNPKDNRITLGLTQKQIAENTGLSASTIRSVEYGKCYTQRTFLALYTFFRTEIIRHHKIK